MPPDGAALKKALQRAQKRIHELCVWIPGWREPYTYVACWQLDTLAGIPHAGSVPPGFTTPWNPTCTGWMKK